MKLPQWINKKTAICLVVALMLAGGGYYLWKSYNSKRAHEEKPKEVVAGGEAIKAVAVVSRTLFREDQLPGEIDAYQDVLIFPKIPGFIKTIDVDRGSVVKEGQLLATMYAPEYLARRNEALSRVAAAKAALAAEESKLQDLEADLKKRQANLLGDQNTYQRVNAASMAPGVIADNDVIQWHQTVEIEREDVNMLIKRVNVKDHEVALRREEVAAKAKAFENHAAFASYLEVRAPYNGYITERKLHVGSFVGPNGNGAYPPICRIKQLDLLRIVAPVPERDTAGVVAGSEVAFSVSTFPGQKFIGTVARISNDLDKATRTMPVELNYFNPDYKIMPGMFCQIYWPTRRRETSLFVPTSAVATTPLDTFVCKLNNGLVEWASVKTGQVMNGMIEVFGRLHEGELVAQKASEELQNQSKAKVLPEEK